MLLLFFLEIYQNVIRQKVVKKLVKEIKGINIGRKEFKYKVILYLKLFAVILKIFFYL